LKKISNVK